MFIKHFPVGALGCNCSIIACPKTKEAIVIDPGDEVKKILKILNEENFKLKFILQTHAHFDHIGASKPLKENCLEASLCLHEGDQFLYDNVALQTGLFGMKSFAVDPIDHYLKDLENLKFGDLKLEVLHTPGHSPGSTCFYLKNEQQNILFSGDTLFRSSIGRTDLWGGDYDQIIRSIQDKILPLPEETLVICGHGPNTQLGFEKEENPFLRE